MKTGKIINMLTVAALTACSQDDEQAVKQAEQTPTGVTISVTDLGMTPLKGTPTRALDRKDYTKDFVAGDQIGVFVVNGNDVTANLKYTLNSAGTWEKAEGEAAITHVEGNVYFAYYPYQDGTDKYTIRTSDYEAGATTADAFFAGLINRWRPAYDQSTQAKYSMQDLMVARATVNDGNVLTFQMEHQMALAEIRFAQVFGNGTAEPFGEGTIGLKYRFKTEENDYQGLDFSWIRPEHVNNHTITLTEKNIYRLIVRPNETVNIQGGIYNPNTDALVTSNPNWYVTTSNQLTKGQYQIFGTASMTNQNTNGAVVKNAYFNLGDILYSDGTFQSSTVSGHGTPVGIVVYKNPGNPYSSKIVNANDNSITVDGNIICEKGLAANYSGLTIAGRGLVMALEDLTQGSNFAFQWATTTDVDEDNTILPNAEYNRADGYFFDGLNKTNYLMGDGTTGTCGHQHPFCQALFSWRKNHAVPVGCSDWFVGSMGQWNQLVAAMYAGLDGYYTDANNNVVNTTKTEWTGRTPSTVHSYASINKAILNAGGTMLTVGDGTGGTSTTNEGIRYWSVDESNSNYASTHYYYNNYQSRASDVFHQDTGSGNTKTQYQKVRPLLAF